jgi:hypothetical protein
MSVLGAGDQKLLVLVLEGEPVRGPDRPSTLNNTQTRKLSSSRVCGFALLAVLALQVNWRLVIRHNAVNTGERLPINP